MPEYFLLCKFTAKGIERIADGSNRVNEVRKLFEKHGGKIKSFHVVLGHYDSVVLVEAPSDEEIAKLSLKIGSLGNVSIQTLRAFDEKQYQGFIQEVAK